MKQFTLLILLLILLVFIPRNRSLLAGKDLIFNTSKSKVTISIQLKKAMRRKAVNLFTSSSDINQFTPERSIISSSSALAATVVVASIFGSTAFISNQFHQLDSKVDALSTMQAKQNDKVEQLGKKINDLSFRFDAAAIGGALFIATFAGAGNIIKVLEYFDKKIG